MFEFENPFKQAIEQANVKDFDTENCTELSTTPDWENADWEGITDAHATEEETSSRADARQSPEAATARIYRKINARRRERTAITAIRYAMLAIGLTAIAWLAREITGLSITLGIIALIFGLTAAYGAGKCHEM